MRLQDPDKEWTLHNAWFVRQLDFNTLFRRRELVKPGDEEKVAEESK